MKRRIVLSVYFGCIYAVSVLVGDAAVAGSTLRQGFGHAIFFGTFFIIVTLPIILLLQAGLTRLTRRILYRKSKQVPILEFLPITLLSLLFLSSLIPESPEDNFTRFVADIQPPSVRDVCCWHYRGFSNGTSVVSFRVSPGEFKQILTRYPYKKTDHPDGASLSRLKSLSERKDCPIEYPKEPMVVEYSYRIPGSHGDFYVSIYTNASHNIVYVIRSDG